MQPGRQLSQCNQRCCLEGNRAEHGTKSCHFDRVHADGAVERDAHQYLATIYPAGCHDGACRNTCCEMALLNPDRSGHDIFESTHSRIPIPLVGDQAASAFLGTSRSQREQSRQEKHGHPTPQPTE
jgi:hypothetical protein